MPSVFLNLSGNSVLPEHETQILRELARETPDHDRLKLVVGNREYEVSHIPWMNGFSITPSSLSRSAERIASHLELQLNGGRTFSQVLGDSILANPPGGSWLHHNTLQEKSLHVYLPSTKMSFLARMSILNVRSHCLCPIKVFLLRHPWIQMSVFYLIMMC